MLYGKYTGCNSLLSRDNRWGRGWVSCLLRQPIFAHQFCPGLAHWCAKNVSGYYFMLYPVAFPRVCRARLSLFDSCYNLDISALVTACLCWRCFSVRKPVLGCRSTKRWELKEWIWKGLWIRPLHPSLPGRAEGPADLVVVGPLLPGLGTLLPCLPCLAGGSDRGFCTLGPHP